MLYDSITQYTSLWFSKFNELSASFTFRIPGFWIIGLVFEGFHYTVIIFHFYVRNKTN